MTKLFSFSHFGLLLTFWVSTVHAAPDLVDMGFSTLPGNQVQVLLNFSDNAPKPQSFTTDNPPRIVLDLPSIGLKTPTKNLDIGLGVIDGVTAVEAGGRTRVVLSMLQNTPYEISRSGTQLAILLGTGGVSPIEKPKSDGVTGILNTLAETAAEEKSESIYVPPSIKAIDFRRGERGAGRIVVSLSEPSIDIDMKLEGQQVLVNFKSTDLPESLDRELDVIDFATPVKRIDTRSQGNNVQMRISTTGQFEHLSYQAGNIYTIEVKQVAPKKEEKINIKDKTYTGERLSLNFQDIDIHAVLNLIADFRSLNIITTDAVKGKVTLKLKNVPWDQALDIILDAKDLGQRRIGSVISIDLKANIEEKEKRELKANSEKKALEPLQTEFFQVNYSKASNFVTLLKKKATGSDEGHSFLSGRGSVSFDERTNTLLLQDTAERLTQIRRLLTELDKPVRQVLIEARVVIASDDFSKSLGVKFGHSTNYTLGDQGWGAITGGRVAGDTSFPSPVAFNEGGAENYIVDLAATASQGAPAAFGIAVGKIGTYLLQLELSAMQEEGRGEIVSSPRIITANQQAASISQGVEIAVQGTPGANAAATPTFKEALLKLDVTPQITPDDRVIMDMNISKDSVISTATGAFSRRQIQTKVLVDNGETVVLGGVYEQTTGNNVSRVPFFGELPVVGSLFRNKTNSTNKQELLIFVTPKILKDGS